MKAYFSFSKTVIGHLHIQKNIPCEDSSSSFSDPEGRYHIAIVADGHGDPACFRSKIGSQIAVEVSTASLQNFAERFFPSESDMQSTMAKTMAFPKERRQAVKQLTDFIISQWTSGVLKHLEENPPTEADWEKVGDKKAEYLEGKHLEHIYGTTLIVALMVSNWLILIQQGDGRCDVFYEDGTVDQPIPWDDRCFENVTTSLCDEDVAQSIRSCVIDTSLQPVIACYLGSDGVEDSYRTMEGTHVFYRELSCELVERPVSEFLDYLEGYFPDFSRSGSGDDVSVAGIVDVEGLSDHVQEFRDSASAYELNEEFEYHNARLISMSRKYGILKRRLDTAQTAYETCERTCVDTQKALLSLEKRLQEKVAEDETTDSDDADGGSSDSARELAQPGFLWPVRELRSEKAEGIRQRPETLKFQAEQLRSQLEQERQKRDSLREKYKEAEQEFTEYDALRQRIQDKCDRIRSQLDRISGQSGEDIPDEDQR